MSLRRFLGLGGGHAHPRDGETETVRRITARLEQLDPDRARFLAAFAYVMARVANADLQIAEEEADAMCRLVAEVGGLDPGQASLVVEIAKSQERLLGGTEDYMVTREFRRISTREERGRLLECLYAVAAADGTISGPESAEILAIAEELGFTRPEALSLRSRYRDALPELRSR